MSTRDAASGPPPPPSPGGFQGDAFEMLKNMWGFTGMGAVPGMPSTADLTQKGPFAQMVKGLPSMMPNMLLPTFDVEELDKRITDLRAVEQWLQLNAGMLRATIQTLEVQRATVATLQQFGEAMLAPKAADAPAAPAAGALPQAALDAAAWWHSLQQQFSQIAAATAGAATAAPPAAKSTRKRPSRP